LHLLVKLLSMLSCTLLVALSIFGSTQHVSAEVVGSIEATLTKQTGRHGPALAAQTARLLGWKGDVARQVHRGDKIRLVYSDNDLPELLALEYDGLKLKIRAYSFEDKDNILRYYDAQGRGIEPAIKSSPLDNYDQITEVPQRGRGKRRHDGVDFKAETGTPIRMPFTGRVNRVNWSTRVNGRCVEVIFKSGKKARFLHLNTVHKAVQAGRTLRAGAPLGTVGSTGRSGGPHLHYEILSPGGKVLNPLEIHGTKAFFVSPTLKKTFESQVKRYQRDLN
jgi:murein DD-endopeptidase